MKKYILIIISVFLIASVSSCWYESNDLNESYSNNYDYEDFCDYYRNNYDNVFQFLSDQGYDLNDVLEFYSDDSIYEYIYEWTNIPNTQSIIGDLIEYERYDDVERLFALADSLGYGTDVFLGSCYYDKATNEIHFSDHLVSIENIGMLRFGNANDFIDDVEDGKTPYILCEECFSYKSN